MCNLLPYPHFVDATLEMAVSVAWVASVYERASYGNQIL